MKMRAFCLAGATALTLVSGARAADMTMDLKAPRAPVYRCDLTGFIELPGTDICFLVGGHALFEFYAAEDQWDVFNTSAAFGIVPDGHTLEDTVGMYAVGRVNFDARTSTEYGTVRAFVEMEAYDNDTRTGGTFGLRHAFVQFGNWTFGKTWSTFLYLDASPIYSDVFIVTGDNFMRRNQIRYTQGFGSGLSFSIAIEDQNYLTPGGISAAGLFFSPPPPNVVVNDRNELPDVVANIRTEGDWGSAQLSGAITNNRYRVVSGAGTAPAPLPGQQTDSDIGWAALAGLVVNAPSLGEDDYFSLMAMYTDGAFQYNDNIFIGATNVVWGLCNTLAPAAGGCILDTVNAWSVLSSYTHTWSPTWSSTIGAGYAFIDAPLVVANAAAFNLASDFEMQTYEIFGNVSWTPVPRITFMVDLHYGHVDFNGTGTFAGVFNPLVANPLAKDNQGAFAGALEVKYTF